MAGLQLQIIIRCIVILSMAMDAKTLPCFLCGWPRSIPRQPTSLVLEVSDTKPQIKQLVYFTCNPQPQEVNFTIHTVTWYKDDERLSDWPHGSLTQMLTVTAADSGLYKCAVVLEHSYMYSMYSSEVQILVYNRDEVAPNMSHLHQLTSYTEQTSTKQRSTITPATNYYQLKSVNIAYGKPTWQSATWSDFGSEKAVDGNTAQVLNSTCALSYIDHYMLGQTAWWSIDLAAGDPSKKFVIEGITIFFRECCLDRIIGVVILVGSKDDIDTQEVCATVTTGNSIQTLPCHPTTPIRFLTVKHATHRFLGLCEVIVNGHQYVNPLSVWMVRIIVISVFIFLSIIIALFMIIRRRKNKVKTTKHDMSALATKKVIVKANVYEPPDVTQPLYEVITERGGHKLLIADTNTPTTFCVNEEQHDVSEPLYEEIGEKYVNK